MGLQIGGVDHDRLLFAVIRREADHHPGEDTLVPPPLPTVVEDLLGAVFSGRVPPPQAIAIDEDNPVQDPSVVDARLAVGLGKIGRQTRHLRVAQPEEIRHVTARFPGVESCRQAEINGA
jgi:hypothetical protein